MSYILDALTRSQKQRERERSSIPTLTAEHMLAESKHSAAHAWPAMFIGLASIAVVIALYTLSVDPLGPVAQRDVRPAEPSASPPRASQPAVITERIADPLSVEQDTADASSLTTPRPEEERVEHHAPSTAGVRARQAIEHGSPAQDAQPTTHVPSETAGARVSAPGKLPERRLTPESRRLVDELMALRSQEEHDAPRARAPSDTSQDLHAAPGVQVARRSEHGGNPPPLGAPTGAASELPSLRELPAETQTAITPLKINVHAYARTSDQRMVMINMKRYGEGDRLREGPLIDAITPTGVVLSFDNQRFQLTAR